MLCNAEFVVPRLLRSFFSFPSPLLILGFSGSDFGFLRAFTGKALFLKVAELVPKHHGRSKKQDASGSASGSSSSAPAGKSGKGGKKKK